jgi:hypothetical protein
VHEAWARDSNRPNPDETYWDAVDAMVEAVGKTRATERNRGLILSVSVLAAERDAFFEQRDAEERTLPKDSFFVVREEVAADYRDVITDPVPFQQIPPMKQLVAEGLKPPQIARMYGLLDHEGNPRVDLVNQELASPGSVINESYVDPRIAHEKQQRALHERARRERLAQSGGQIILTAASDAELDPADEDTGDWRVTAQELAREGYEPADIAADLGVSVGRVQSLLAGAQDTASTE